MPKASRLKLPVIPADVVVWPTDVGGSGARHVAGAIARAGILCRAQSALCVTEEETVAMPVGQGDSERRPRIEIVPHGEQRESVSLVLGLVRIAREERSRRVAEL